MKTDDETEKLLRDIRNGFYEALQALEKAGNGALDVSGCSDEMSASARAKIQNVGMLARTRYERLDALYDSLSDE